MTSKDNPDPKAPIANTAAAPKVKQAPVAPAPVVPVAPAEPVVAAVEAPAEPVPVEEIVAQPVTEEPLVEETGGVSGIGKGKGRPLLMTRFYQNLLGAATAWIGR